jgi:hypothetical protein
MKWIIALAVVVVLFGVSASLRASDAQFSILTFSKNF